MSAFAIPGMLVFGTSTVVISKILFSMNVKTGPGADDVKLFKKPWAQTDAMFAGMLLCLIAHFVLVLTGKYNSQPEPEKQKLVKKGGQGYGSINSSARRPKAETSNLQTYLIVAIPAICDLVATVLANIGLQWISASVWQMLRGAMVVFSAILSIMFLNRKFYLFNWIGISLVLLALVCVGFSCMNAPAAPGQVVENPANVVFGIILVIVAQFVQASQIVIEEFLLKSVKAPPLLIVGLEGFWGFLLTTFVFLPTFQHVQWHGFSENSSETGYMLTHDTTLLLTVLLYVVVILLYNATAMMVTQQFTAVHRTILEAMRTLCIWVVNLFIYYEVNSGYGEHWSVWSWFELLGFVVLLFGLFIYNEVIKLPCLPDFKMVDLAEHPEKALEAGRPPPLLPPQSPYIRSPRV